jgi:Zn-finger nucleic acid-binding protein
MPAHAPCPKCRGQFVELERNGIKIDVCQECRGVFLDRGELDQIIAAEQRAVSDVYSEDERFFHQLAGQEQPPPAQPADQPPPAQPAYQPPPPQPADPPPPAQPAYQPPPPHHGHGRPLHQQYGFDRKTAERLLGDFRSHQSSHKKKHRKSLLQQLFD